MIWGYLLAAAVLAGACAWSLISQWRDAARRSDKHALQIWALHSARLCYCSSCRQARRFLGLVERPRVRARARG